MPRQNKKNKNAKKVKTQGNVTNRKSSSPNEDNIEMSKQLSKRKSTSSPRAKVNNSKKRKRSNVKPLPSLSKLEKMFEDSKSENENDSSIENSSTNPNEECRNNTNQSPETDQNIAHCLTDRIASITDPNELNELPPAISPIKRKKPENVDCKDRPGIEQKVQTNFSKESSESGVDGNVLNESDKVPKKRTRRSKIQNVSNSSFNDNSDEITNTLKHIKSNNGNINTTSVPPSLQSFSPLPSTSRDHETILQNDDLFNNSLNKSVSINEDVGDSKEVQPDSRDPISKQDTNDLERVMVLNEVIVLDDSSAEGICSPTSKTSGFDNSVQIIELNTTMLNDNSTIIIDDYPTHHVMEDHNSDVVEVIDVDDIIAENVSLLKKYKRNTTDTVITIIDTGKSSKLDRPKNTKAENIITGSDKNQNCSVSSNNSSDKNVVVEVDGIYYEITPDNNIKVVSSSKISSHTNPENKVSNISIINNINASNTPTMNSNNSGQSLANSDNMLHHTQASTSTNKIPSTNCEKTIIHSPKAHGGIGDCPICMETLANKQVASTFCGHLFCLKCMNNIVKTKGKKMCPTCRKPFKGVGYHQIFL